MKNLHVIGRAFGRWPMVPINFTVTDDFIAECFRVRRRTEVSQDEFLMNLTLSPGWAKRWDIIADSIIQRDARWHKGVLECIGEEFEIFIAEDINTAKIAFVDYLLRGGGM